MARNSLEKIVHAQICEYVRRFHPEVIFTSEPSGLFVTYNQAKELKKLRSHSGLPDLWILAPRGGYHGLFLEIKTEKASPYKKDGTIRQQEHIQNQALTLKRLLREGYFANFAVGYDSAVRQIQTYMEGLDMTPYLVP